MEPHNQSTLRQIKVVSIYVTYFIQGVYFRYSPFPHCLLFRLVGLFDFRECTFMEEKHAMVRGGKGML